MFHRVSYALVAVLAVVAVLTLGFRFALSQAGNYEDEIVAQLSEAVGAEVGIGAMRVTLSGVEPVAELSDVRIEPSGGADAGLHAGRMRIGFDLFASLLSRRPVISDLHVMDTDFLVVTDTDGNSHISGFSSAGFPARDAPSGVGPGFNFHLGRANIRWRNDLAGVEHEFRNVNVMFESVDGRLRVAAKTELPPALGRIVHVAADLGGIAAADDASGRWEGRVYVRADDADVAQWARLAGTPGIAGEGRLSAELWSDWRDGALQRLDGAFNCGNCAVAVDGEGSELVSAQARLSWEARENGWWLGMLDLGWASPGLTVGNSDVALAYREGGSRVVLRAPVLDKSLLRTIAGGAERFHESGVEISAGHGAAALSAVVSHPDFKPPILAEAPEQAGMSGWRNLLEDRARFVSEYASGYTGHLLQFPAVETAQVNFGLKGITAGFSGWSEQVFDLGEVSASIHYADDGSAYAVHADNLSVRFGDARLSGRLAWLGGETPAMEAGISVEDLPLASVGALLPREGLKPRLRGWLEHAFAAGVLKSARVEFDGPPSSFPFKDGGGRFYAEGEVEGATLNYRANRQPLRDVNARVVFAGQGMTVEASSLRYYDLRSQSAKAVIKDVTLPFIEVDATGAGPFASVFAYLRDARMVNPDSVVIRSLEPGGGSRLDLSVKAPLSKSVDKPVTVEGALTFDKTSLRVAPLDLEFTDITGVLGFDRGGGTSQSLAANLNGLPVTGGAKPAEGEASGATLLTLEGDLPPSKLLDLSGTPLDGAVQGVAPWRAGLLVPSLRAGAAYELKMTLASSLEGVAVALPVPFGKTAAERRDFSADVELGTQSRYVLSYGGETRAALFTDARTSQPWGYLHFGRAAPPAVERGRFKVGGEISSAVEIDDWLQFTDGDGDFGRYLDRAAVSFAELRKGGDVLGEASVALNPRDGGRELQIAAPWAQGWIFMPAADDRAVRVEMERLFLPKGSSTDTGTDTGTTLDPATVPPLEIEIADFRHGGLKVSGLHLLTAPSDGGMRIRRFAFEAGDVVVGMSGQWLFDGQDHRSRFHLEANGRNYGEMLRLLDASSSLKGGDGALIGRVTWADRPAGFTLEKLEGNVKVDLKDGVIEEADPGISRLLGLFSVGHVVRRLSLDFSDVIEKGLTFDTLEGRLDFRNSVMHTEDFVITGPALAMAISGDNNIADKQYDQQIDVVPNLSSGLPIAGALLAGPLAGAAVFLVDKLTNIGSRMDKVVTLRYHLHGSWDDPQMDFAGTPEVEKGPGKLKRLLDKVIP